MELKQVFWSQNLKVVADKPFEARITVESVIKLGQKVDNAFRVTLHDKHRDNDKESSKGNIVFYDAKSLSACKNIKVTVKSCSFTKHEGSKKSTGIQIEGKQIKLATDRSSLENHEGSMFLSAVVQPKAGDGNQTQPLRGLLKQKEVEVTCNLQIMLMIDKEKIDVPTLSPVVFKVQAGEPKELQIIDRDSILTDVENHTSLPKVRCMYV